jgi:hypothetical protein
MEAKKWKKSIFFISYTQIARLAKAEQQLLLCGRNQKRPLICA